MKWLLNCLINIKLNLDSGSHIPQHEQLMRSWLSWRSQWQPLYRIFVVKKWNYTVQAGTYFYHGHYGMQRSSGLYGSLIVDVAEGEKERFEYDGELNILVSDWWHKGSREQEVDLSSKPMRWIGEPQVYIYI